MKKSTGNLFAVAGLVVSVIILLFGNNIIGRLINRGSPASKIVVDGDGNVYRTAQIIGKTWLAENLNYYVLGSFCYENDPVNCQKRGKLYTWDAAKKACKNLGVGWRLPTDEEWKELTVFFGGYNEIGRCCMNQRYNYIRWARKKGQRPGAIVLFPIRATKK